MTRDEYLLQYCVTSFVSMFLIAHQPGVSPEVLAVAERGIDAASSEIKRLGREMLQTLVSKDDYS